MDNQFAPLVDPIVQYVLDIQRRIAGPRDSHPGADDVYDELVRLFQKSRQAAATLDRPRDYTELAERALVYWADEVLINSNWEHAQTWLLNKLLERTFYQERVAGSEFFARAKLAKVQSRDALETFLLCTALGFRGMYARDDGQVVRNTANRRVDPELARIGLDYYQQVRPQIKPFWAEDPKGASETPSLPGRTLLLRVSILTAVTVLTTLGVWILTEHLNG